VFDILFSSSENLLPLDYLQGTPKKICESLEKLHSSNDSTKSKRGTLTLFNSFKLLLKKVAADTPRKFTHCFTDLDEPRVVRKVNNLFNCIRELTPLGGSTPGGKSNNTSSGATPGRMGGGGGGSPNSSRLSAAMKSYEEFGEESGLDSNVTGDLSRAGVDKRNTSNIVEDEGEIETGGEGDDGSDDEFDF